MNTLILTPTEQVILTEFDDETGLLVNLQTKRYYNLNETGVFIWKAISAGKTIEEIVSNLIETYETDEDRALQSVEKFVDQLKSQKLLEIQK